jgi:hypothetical protein
MEIYKQLTGVWKLTAWKMQRGDTPLDPPLGPASQCEGLLIYTTDLYVSVTLSIRDRSQFVDQAFDGGTVEEKRRAYETFLSYAGKFEVKEATRTIEHHVEMSSYPNFSGQTQVRLYELRENQLILSVPSVNIGNQIQSGYLAWQRLSS